MRNLTANLDAVMVTATTRSPAFQVLIYDLRSSGDAMTEVVRLNLGLEGVSLSPISGPRDFTADVESVQVQEQRGDYVNGGVASASVTITLIDPSGLMDPIGILGLDPDSDEYANALGRYLRAGNAVVVRVGDTRVDSAEWATVFTGKIVGQAGRLRGRSDGAVSTITLRALSREADFIRFNRTSDPFANGVTFLQAATDIAETEMGLDVDEISLFGWGTALIAHNPTQFVEEPPIVMLARLMFLDGFMPRFDGDGRLTQTTAVVTATPERVYDSLDLFRRIERPFSDVDQPNCVTVVGLDAELSKVVQPKQRLATSDITTGFFTNGEDFTVYWSDDQTIVAENVQTRVLKSVNGGLSALGGGESFEFIPAPGPGGGTIGVRVTVDTGYAPWLVVFLLVTYIALSLIPDEVLVASFGAGGGFTIPTGRAIQAAALASALFIMTKIARGQYEFLGEPLEYVYAEIRARACVDGVGEFDRNSVEIENHLVNTLVGARNAARNTLFLLQAEENPRSIEMLHDLKLEPDDIFQLPTGQRYLIDSVSYTLRRDGRAPLAQLGCFEVTTGVVA